MSWECEICASSFTRAYPRVKKERKKDTLKYYFVPKKVSILSYQRTFLLRVLATRPPHHFGFLVNYYWCSLRPRRKSVDFLGTKSKKKGNKKNSTLINHRFVRERSCFSPPPGGPPRRRTTRRTPRKKGRRRSGCTGRRNTSSNSEDEAFFSARRRLHIIIIIRRRTSCDERRRWAIC